MFGGPFLSEPEPSVVENKNQKNLVFFKPESILRKTYFVYKENQAHKIK